MAVILITLKTWRLYFLCFPSVLFITRDDYIGTSSLVRQVDQQDSFNQVCVQVPATFSVKKAFHRFVYSVGVWLMI